MTHEEKRQRREEIAKAVATGSSLPEVARRFRVGLRTVYDSCREFDVDVPGRRQHVSA